jgi:mitochondrial fusion and transport protein UGO1
MRFGQKKELGGYGKVFIRFNHSVISGTNSTFAYSVLFDGIETWLSSLLAATFALPDPTLFDILDSPTPGVSLAAALTATAVTALILAPIDLYRITYLSTVLHLLTTEK